MSRSLPLVLALLVLSIAVAAPVEAVLITVNFTVNTPDYDPAYPNQTFNGSFSVDSSIIPSGGGALGAFNGANDYSASIDWTFDGYSWNSDNAALTRIVFDANGNVVGWVLEGDPQGGFFPNSNDMNVYSDATLAGGGAPEGYSYGQIGITDAVASNMVTFTQSTSSDAPEPSSWLLLATGFLGFVGIVRHRGNNNV